ncbi:hypothetical protein ACG7TL_000105 [Trametes sanguinea]
MLRRTDIASGFAGGSLDAPLLLATLCTPPSVLSFKFVLTSTVLTALIQSPSSMAIPLLPWFREIVIIAAAILGVHSLDIRVDDSNATISYSPADQWSQGITCGDCTIHPDASHAFEGTWHDTTYIPQRSDPMTITFSFTGTAIQVFNILPPVVSAAPTTHTDLTFILDSEVVHSFKADPASGADFQYNVQVFRQDELENIEHTLTIQTTSGIESVVLFDYLIYTVPDPPPVKPGPIPPPTSSVTSITTATTTTTTSSSSPGTLSSSTTPSSLSSSQSSALLLSPPTSTESITSSTSSVRTSIPSQVSGHAGQTEGGLTAIPSGYVSDPGQSNSETSTSPVATAHPQAKSQTGTIPLTTVIGVAIGGSLALLVLIAALVYILCVRRAKRRLALLKQDSAQAPERRKDAQLSQLRRELYPSLVTQRGLATSQRDPFADPAPGVRLADGASVGSHEWHSSEDEQSIIVIGEGTRPASLVPSMQPTHTADSTLESPRASRTVSQQSIPLQATSLDHPSSEEDKPLLPTVLEIETVPEQSTSPEPARGPGRQLPPIPNPVLLEHLAALEVEVAWLRANRQADDLMPDDLPRYDEVKS